MASDWDKVLAGGALDSQSEEIANDRIRGQALLAPNAQIYTATHTMNYLERRNWTAYNKPVRIGDDCWIGGGAIICPGVTIGPRSIIGAGAVVTRDIPADSVAVGNPAKVIRPLKQDEERCWELAQ